MALGEYPTVSLARARELHFEGRRMLAAGIDPMAERKAKTKRGRSTAARNVMSHSANDKGRNLCRSAAEVFA